MEIELPIAKRTYLEGTSCKKLSVEEMNKIVLEKIPLDERLRSVYLPIIAMDCACYLAEDLLVALKELSMSETKKTSRVIRSCIEGYRSDNRKAMQTTLYKDLSATTKEFYTSIAANMTIYWLQYKQAMLNMNLDISKAAQKTVALTYVTREIIRFVLDMDRMFSKRISELLGAGIKYTTEDNQYCLTLVEALGQVLKAVKVPDDLRTQHTDNAFRIFKNQINAVKI